ncbi:putative calcium-binding protein CML19 [Typha angustifolia]|uniref:putative calcium-binding protein CML19 n=1 Tax=Typha angustifolia TaxID=59011 RepID=UPI003C2C01AD
MAKSPASHVKITERSKMERIFTRFDADGDGKISAAELRRVMKTVGEELTADDAEAAVESADSDGDGLLDLEDFVRLVGVLEGGDEEERELREAFGMYEMEGEGCITAKSLKRMLSRLGTSKKLEECMVMIERFDLNGDGVLCFEEFKSMMML